MTQCAGSLSLYNESASCGGPLLGVCHNDDHTQPITAPSTMHAAPPILHLIVYLPCLLRGVHYNIQNTLNTNQGTLLPLNGSLIPCEPNIFPGPLDNNLRRRISVICRRWDLTRRLRVLERIRHNCFRSVDTVKRRGNRRT